MSLGNRFVGSLFVALAVGLGWGIRGDFGHLLGAMYPGAALGLGFAYVSGQRSAFKWMPILGAIGALGISTGGSMSYGILHGYAKSDTFINYTYGFFTLLLEGGAWGCFGCALIGLALEEKPLKALELVSLTATVFFFGFLFYAIVVMGLGFHINPPRSDESIGFTGGVVGLFIWLGLSDRSYGRRGALLGYLGFGLGMALGRLLANASYLQPFPVNHWNIMEVMCGFIGGFVFTYGMLGIRFPDPPEEKSFTFLGFYSSLYVLFLIPVFHRLLRIDPAEKLDQWTKSLESYGYSNPAALSQFTMTAIYGVCVLGLICALFWFWLFYTDKEKWIAFPVMALSLVMLLIQNLNALYLFYPRQTGSINMHFVFWVIIALMGLIVYLRRHVVVDEYIESDEHFEGWKWIFVGILVFVCIVILAGLINGEETMKSAHTRFPLWSWSDGPPVGQ